ncbi:hypothetical protein CDL12_01456 [Handroanthus impetiginosus]|uniref:C2 domain-containing protein n=1 Tax=Handroanthus impetiginosus TaxID=429701 RepID=A0A2G9I844_9LAMI|nr:hypothetical protein CDL12_01456 [Handroanthus impetiginosus]
MQSHPPQEFYLKETNAHLEGWKFNGDNLKINYDHVREMQFVYVRVVKAIDLPENDVTGSCDPYVEVKLGNYKNTTDHLEKNSNPGWNKVFTISKDQIQGSILEVFVKDKDVVNDDYIGRVVFDLDDIPNMVSQNGGLLAPQWYSLEDKKNEKAKGELLLAVWMGTEADDVSHLDASESNICSSVHLSPKLWYLKVTVIEAQDLQPSDERPFPDVFVKAMLGNQTLRTTVSTNKTTNPTWNEDLVFVAAEPFHVPLIFSVEDRIAPNKGEVLGKCDIRLQHVDRRLDRKPLNSRWYNLERHILVEDEKKNEVTFSGKIHMIICLEGGYCVPDESPHYSSDLRPTEKQLWKSRIGVLELGILDARGLLPMKIKDGQETTDAYCVAKYGQKWFRTRTIIDSFDPVWNEQYTWEVFDPCTVVTIGVFDNFHLQVGEKSRRDSRIGKLRIRLSALETDRIYSRSFPLLVLQPSGLKKMGELHLAVRFTCSSLINMMHIYSQPLLPKMHYIQPLTVSQIDKLRHQATQIVSIRLSRAEPPLRKEVVQYLLEVGSDTWSMRKSKINFFRVMAIFNVFVDVWRWFDRICNWKNPVITVLIHILFLILVMYRQHLLPSIFLCLFLFIAWYYEWKPEHPLHIDTRLSQADNVHPDELDEEFDMFPSLCAADLVRMRYDRLRSVAGRIQTVLGDLATQGERLQYLLCWRDPRATVVFAIFCLIAAFVLYITPFEVVAILTGFYVLRHPRFRSKLDSVPLNFFKRLPERSGCLL